MAEPIITKEGDGYFTRKMVLGLKQIVRCMTMTKNYFDESYFTMPVDDSEIVLYKGKEIIELK